MVLVNARTFEYVYFLRLDSNKDDKTAAIQFDVRI